VCTILILHQAAAAHPLVIAANRDEMYGRPASAPQVREHGGRRLIAGIDEVHGGSWMGCSDDCLFVGLTNQRNYFGRDPEARSRGEVVMQALESGSVAGVHALLLELDARKYNPFNLVYGDARELEVAYARREQAEVELETVPPGIHVLPNDRLNSPAFPKVARARSRLQQLCDLAWPELFDGLATLLSDHQLPDADAVEEPPPTSMFDAATARKLHALCIHTEHYGTRSATIAALEPGRVAHYAFAPQAPCQSDLADMTALVYGDRA